MFVVRWVSRPSLDADAMHSCTQWSTIGTWHLWLTVMKTLKQKEGSTLEQYGALPWRVTREGQFEVLLVTSRRRGRWTVPKGWKVNHRSASQSAETEAFEEAGVIGHAIPEPIGVVFTRSYRRMGRPSHAGSSSSSCTFRARYTDGLR